MNVQRPAPPRPLTEVEQRSLKVHDHRIWRLAVGGTRKIDID